MFKAYINRHSGCPWGSSGLTSATWLDVPLAEVDISELVATQMAFFFHAITDSDFLHLGIDPHPHVIHWDGVFYVEDGHHRVLKAMLADKTHMHVRLLIL